MELHTIACVSIPANYSEVGITPHFGRVQNLTQKKCAVQPTSSVTYFYCSICSLLAYMSQKGKYINCLCALYMYTIMYITIWKFSLVKPF